MDYGQFITFEGGEGAGKSTQTQHLAKFLEQSNKSVLLTREPGGTQTAEEIRALLLSPERSENFTPLTELLLFFAARQEHLEKKIRPALKAGQWVICDRFIDSSRAYQGGAGGVDSETLAQLEKRVVGRTLPNLTIILDIPAEEGLRRARARARGVQQDAAQDIGLDGFEKRDIAFHETLRQAFIEIAAQEPARCIVIDALQSEQEIARQIKQAVTARLKIGQ